MNTIKKIITDWLQSPYARLIRVDKPVGIFLLLFPVLWSILFAADTFTKALIYTPMFCIGGVIMRSAGCIINDIIDMKSDSQIRRTKIRPIASGEIKIADAIKLLCILLIIALLLLIALPFKAIVIAAISLVFIIIYPMMKYITHYAQIVLGFVFNIGVIIAWITISQKLSFVPIIIYFAAAFWTIGYDTIYALQDKDGDKELGLKSLAIKLGTKSTITVKHAYITMITLLVLAGLNSHMNILYYIGLACAMYHLNWQTETLNADNSNNCNERFCSNVEVGAIILLAVLLGKF